jgi:hypothetical protein
MKTADTIEQQEARKAARNNGSNTHSSRELTQSVTPKRGRGDASRIAAWRWQPGKSANPGGVPKHDVSKEIAEAIFRNNPEMIYGAYCKILRRGNAYAFQVLADRAFGKLRERHEIEVGPYHDLTEEDLLKRVHELESELGIAPALPADDTTKPN